MDFKQVVNEIDQYKIVTLSRTTLRNYLTKQPYIKLDYFTTLQCGMVNKKLRSILGQWMLNVCIQKRLPQSAAVRAMVIFDSYCSSISCVQYDDLLKTRENKYSLTMAICLDIAAKIEYRGIFKVLPASFNVDLQQLLSLEYKVLEIINYNSTFTIATELIEVMLYEIRPILDINFFKIVEITNQYIMIMFWQEIYVKQETLTLTALVCATKQLFGKQESVSLIRNIQKIATRLKIILNYQIAEQYYQKTIQPEFVSS